MEKQLEQALAVLITKSLDSVDAAGQFLKAEIPDVISQLLVWYGWYNFILFIFGIALLVGIVWGNYIQYKLVKKHWITIRQADGEVGLVFNMFQILWFIPLTVLIDVKWLQIWIAPKIWLIEYASKLIGK